MSAKLRITTKYFFITTLVACTLSCSSTNNRASYYPTAGWRVSSPEQQGIDSSRLASLVETIIVGDYDVDSLLIIRNGYLVLDAYFSPYTGDRPHDVASVTKSVTALLAAAALKQGVFQSLNEPLLPMVNGPDSKSTLRNFLDMTSGLDCGYSPGEPEMWEMIHTADWVKYARELPARVQAGTEFSYCSPGSHLIAHAIEAVAKESLVDFSKRHLFEPLGIVDYYWPTDPDGILIGHGDLRLFPKDMAKIGYLMLQNGYWDGVQLLPKSWVNSVSQPRIQTDDPSTFYSLGWWVHTGDLEGVYEARGRGGQSITISPKHNLIVVFTGSGLDKRGELAPLIISSLVSQDALPTNPEGAAALKRALERASELPKASPIPEPPSVQANVMGEIYELIPTLQDVMCFRIDFDTADKSTIHLTLWMSQGAVEIEVGLDELPRYTDDVRGFSVGSVGHWENEHIFSLSYDALAGISHFDVAINFAEDKLTIKDKTGLFGSATANFQNVPNCGKG